MNSIIQAFLKPFTGLVSAFKRFPVTIIFSLVACFSFSIYYISGFENKMFLQILVAALSGFMLNINLEILLEKYSILKNFTLFVYVAGTILPMLMFLLIYLFFGDFLGIARSLVVLICLFIAYLLIPGHNSEQFDFDEMIFITIRAIVVSFIYTMVIGSGIYVIYIIIKNLLFSNLLISFTPILLSISLFIFSLFVLSLLPRFSNDLDVNEYNKYTKPALYFERIVAYIFVPVLSIITFIFVGYGAKILITWNWPTNNFAIYSIAYLITGIFVYLLTEPISNDICIIYRKYFPIVMIPVIIMLCLSTYFRITLYGITEQRYILILFIIFCVACAFIFNFLSERNNRKAFVVFGIIAIISVMPIINFKDVSNFSQSMRGEKILIKNGMIESGIVSIKPENLASISKEDKTEVGEVVNYLISNNGVSHANWLPTDFKIQDFQTYFGFSPFFDINTDNFLWRTYILDRQSFDINGYSVFVIPQTDRFENGYISTAFFSSKKWDYFLELKNDNTNNDLILTVKRNNVVIYNNKLTDISNMIKADLENISNNNSSDSIIKLPVDKLSATITADKSTVMLVFNTVTANENYSSGTNKIINLTFDVNVFVKD